MRRELRVLNAPKFCKCNLSKRVAQGLMRRREGLRHRSKASEQRTAPARLSKSAFVWVRTTLHRSISSLFHQLLSFLLASGPGSILNSCADCSRLSSQARRATSSSSSDRGCLPSCAVRSVDLCLGILRKSLALERAFSLPDVLRLEQSVPLPSCDILNRRKPPLLSPTHQLAACPHSSLAITIATIIRQSGDARVEEPLMPDVDAATFLPRPSSRKSDALAQTQKSLLSIEL